MNDLISRQAAIDALAKTAGIGNRALDAIRALPAAHCDNCQRWASTKERLPDAPGLYLVTIKHQRMPARIMIRMMPEKCNRWRDPRNGIKAWMPLPDPWKEGESI